MLRDNIAYDSEFAKKEKSNSLLSDVTRRRHVEKKRKHLVFKISLRSNTKPQERQPYQLIMGTYFCGKEAINSEEIAGLFIDNNSEYPLKSHSSWLQRLITELDNSNTEPRLRVEVNDRCIEQQRKIEWLTPRESQVLRYRHMGFTAKESAAQLGISHRTVEKQLELVRNKLGVSRLSPIYICSILNTHKLIENHLNQFPPAVQQMKVSK